MKMFGAENWNNCKLRALEETVQQKCKIPIGTIEISGATGAYPSVFICVANWRSRATNAVDATESVRSRR